jgi:hypothetical protein
MESASNPPSSAQPVKPIAFGKQAKFFQWEWPKTANRHGHNVMIDVEWQPCNGAIEIETLSINGHEMSHAFEQLGVLADLSERIEAAILAKISE